MRKRLLLLLAGLLLAWLGAACNVGPGQPATALPPQAASATAVAATANAQVEAWAIATGTALKLTARANLTPVVPSLNPVLGQPLATATLAICNYLSTDCGAIAGASTQPPATATLAAIATPAPPTFALPAITQPPPATLPLPATATPPGADCFFKTCQLELAAPDGQHTWPETCTNLGLDLDCYLTFPNGQQTTHFRWPVIWSADSQFLAIPEGGTHDSPASGYEIWNMAEGVKTGRFDYNSHWQWWSPTGHTLAYLKRLPTGEQEFRLMDAATGADQPTRQCPAWATDQNKLSDALNWRQICDNWTPPAGEPVILSFTVEPTEASPGDKITVNWSSANASSAQLTAYSVGNAPGVPVAVPPSGNFAVTVNKNDVAGYAFQIVITGAAGQTDQRIRSVSLLCADTFFFTNSNRPLTGGCPYRPAAFVAAAQQTFEHGQMIWLAPVAGESTASGVAQGASIYILYNAGVADTWASWQKYDDPWVSGQPESDPTLEPPAGLYQPQRGFGKVWRVLPGVREKLGWATAPEQGFDGAHLVQWRYGNPPGDLYLRAADKSILYLQLDGYWWYIQH